MRPRYAAPMPSHAPKITTCLLCFLPSSASAGDDAIFLSGGYTYTLVDGSSPGEGHGFDLSLPIFSGTIVRFGPFAQGRWLDDGEPPA